MNNPPNKIKFFFKFLVGLGLLPILTGCMLLPILTSESSPREIVDSTLPVTLEWQSNLDSPVKSQSLGTEFFFIVPTAKTIYGINSTTGETTWEHTLTSPQSVSKVPLDSDEAIVVYGDTKSKVTALELDSGNILWQHEISSDKKYDHRVVDIVLENGWVYVAYQPTFIEALNAKTGELVWGLEGTENGMDSRGAQLVSDPSMQDLIVTTYDAAFLDKASGKITKVVKSGFGGFPQLTQLHDGKLYGPEWVNDIGTGRSNKITQAGKCGFRQPYLFYEDRYFAVNECGGVYAMALADNTVLWKYRPDLSGESPLTIQDRSLYVMFGNGEIHAITPDTGENNGKLITNLRLPGWVEAANFTSRGITSNGSTLIATFNDTNVWGFR